MNSSPDQVKQKKPRSLIPNSCQTPNVYYDRFMPFLTGDEWKVLSYTIRRTLGFQKKRDRISLSQYSTGKHTSDGKQIDYGTGLSVPTIRGCLAELIKFGMVREVAPNNGKNQGAAYELQLDYKKVNFVAVRERRDNKSQAAKSKMSKAKERAMALQGSNGIAGGVQSHYTLAYNGIATQNPALNPALNPESILSEATPPTTQSSESQSWHAINHMTKQLIVPGQSRALLNVDMSMLSNDWLPVELEKEDEYKGYARISLSEASESPSTVAPVPPSPALRVVGSFNPAQLRMAMNIRGMDAARLIALTHIPPEMMQAYMDLEIVPLEDDLIKIGAALQFAVNFFFRESVTRIEIPAQTTSPHPSESNDGNSQPVVPVADATPAPKGTRWIYPFEGDIKHLVSNANAPDNTLCGIKVPSHASGGESPSHQTPCEACLKASQEKPKRVRKPQPTDPLFDAIGRVVLGAKTPADVEAVGYSIGQIIHGDKKNRRWVGIIPYEKARQEKDELNYEALAKDVEKFWKAYQEEHPGYELKDCKKFGEQWVKWRGTQIASTPNLVDDPDNPGKKITQGQLNIRNAEKRMIESLNANK